MWCILCYHAHVGFGVGLKLKQVDIKMEGVFLVYSLEQPYKKQHDVLITKDANVLDI